MTLLFFSIILLLSFYLLAKVCDEYFVNSLDRISEKLKLSSDVAGATLMAVGSSAPELFVAIISLLKPGDTAAVGMGTIVGSAIFNILVIIGAAAVIRKAVLAWQPVIRDTAFYSVAIIMLILVFRDGFITLGESALFVGLYIVYIIAVLNWRRWLPYKDDNKLPDSPKPVRSRFSRVAKLALKPIDWLLDKLFPPAKYYYGVFIISIIIIAALSWVLVESAVVISGVLNIPAVIVALTVLAAGTSIPDLISSMIVARQGRGGMAISNAIGSNIFDILFGLGVPWFVMLLISGHSIAVSTEALVSSVILLFATVLVIFFLLLSKRWKIGKHSGYFLILLYLVYLVWSIIKAY